MSDLVRYSPPAFVFDLDGTLVDSVYQHVISWQEPSSKRTSCSRPGGSTARSA
ncbi:hypothetical protein ACU686_29075 [Yinghuangia aomiensis]